MADEGSHACCTDSMNRFVARRRNGTKIAAGPAAASRTQSATGVQVNAGEAISRRAGGRARSSKLKISATTTVMRSRFFSTTVEPGRRRTQAATERVGERPPALLCRSTSRMSRPLWRSVDPDDDGGEHEVDPIGPVRPGGSARSSRSRRASRAGAADEGPRRCRLGRPGSAALPGFTEPPYWIPHRRRGLRAGDRRHHRG